ncbi:hydrolase [Schinkia azotoformans]|uniref:hydrolase n=1 Tax=Schinkia azotoformans TaxID=1454 RepID=UPI002DB8F389|nr:hydrolase [Schinkia azotoformans]MEC1771145.1 hydrolase [Schinkia azotoformans]MED4364978.1 hydrolase [Schinkia azotoformans]
MEKQTYYISVGSRGISQIKTGTPFELEIEATDDEIRALRGIFDEMYNADVMGFLRAHVPFWEYHNDRENDIIDRNLMNVYQMLYDLGKPETKQHIESMGILTNYDGENHSTM